MAHSYNSLRSYRACLSAKAENGINLLVSQRKCCLSGSSSFPFLNSTGGARIVCPFNGPYKTSSSHTPLPPPTNTHTLSIKSFWIKFLHFSNIPILMLSLICCFFSVLKWFLVCKTWCSMWWYIYFCCFMSACVCITNENSAG